MRKSLDCPGDLVTCLCWEPHRFRWRSYFLALIIFPHLGQMGIAKASGRVRYALWRIGADGMLY
jgi:hypothetical protein